MNGDYGRLSVLLHDCYWTTFITLQERLYVKFLNQTRLRSHLTTQGAPPSDEVQTLEDLRYNGKLIVQLKLEITCERTERSCCIGSASPVLEAVSPQPLMVVQAFVNDSPTCDRRGRRAS